MFPTMVGGLRNNTWMNTQHYLYRNSSQLPAALSGGYFLVFNNNLNERKFVMNFDLENNENGRSMIEMLGVLAIIGVLSVGGIAGYSKAMQKYRINKTIEQITLIAGNIRAFFGPQKNYLGVYCNGYSCNTTDGCMGHSGVDSDGNITYAQNGCPIIKKAKILPDEMITVNAAGKITSITNPFGGWVNLFTEHKSTFGDNQAFSIGYDFGDDMEACIELLSHDWQASGMVAVYTDTSSKGEAIAKVPLSVEAATNFCVDSDDENLLFDIDWNWWSDGLYIYE